MKKILIVDDSAFLRGILKGYLSKTRTKGPLAGGCQLMEADGVAAAWTSFEEGKPDLVLLDIVMGSGGREGIEVLRAIKKSVTRGAATQGSDPGPKVVMLTAVGQEKIIEECKALGADDYVTKPFNETELLAVVEKHLGGGGVTVRRGAARADNKAGRLF